MLTSESNIINETSCVSNILRPLSFHYQPLCRDPPLTPYKIVSNIHPWLNKIENTATIGCLSRQFDSTHATTCVCVKWCRSRIVTHRHSIYHSKSTYGTPLTMFTSHNLMKEGGRKEKILNPPNALQKILRLRSHRNAYSSEGEKQNDAEGGLGTTYLILIDRTINNESRI